jgi:hypothetical protein
MIYEVKTGTSVPVCRHNPGGLRRVFHPQFQHSRRRQKIGLSERLGDGLKPREISELREIFRTRDSGGPRWVICRATVEGEQQDLSPIVQDEVYRIAREVLRNAFRHARACQIEVEIRYGERLGSEPGQEGIPCAKRFWPMRAFYDQTRPNAR